MNGAGASERILVFIPMYRCEAQVPRVIAQFAQDLWLAENVSLLCVDNRSPDGTAEAAERALAASPVPEKYLVRNDDNYGLGGSHKVAFEFARRYDFDYVVVLHGDDQGSIADIVPLLKEGVHRSLDALLGARFMRGATLKGYPILRTSANHAFNWIFSAVARKRFFDLGSGLNLFRRSIFDDGFHLKYADNLTFNYFLVFGLADLGKRYRFFPIHWSEDDQISNAKLFSQGVSMLRMLRDRVLAKERFLAAEHRAVPRDAYPFTILRQWGGKPQDGAAAQA